MVCVWGGRVLGGWGDYMRDEGASRGGGGDGV